jgi:SAM-dependent methyltransferase
MTPGSQSDDIAAEFARLNPWIFRFNIGGTDYGGNISAVGDERLAQFWAFAPEAQRILELGALEGAHTVQLAAPAGVREVVAIEGRAANMRKLELVQRLSGITNARVVEANLESTDLTQFGQFDAVFCSGLLYHLPEPWALIEQLARITPKLFIWTHYGDDISAGEVRHGLRGHVHVEGGPDEPLSGLSQTAFWPTLGSLITLLTSCGFASVDIIYHDPQHPNAPAVTIGAAKAPIAG